MAKDFSSNTFNQNLKDAYDPDMTREDKAEVLNYFLAYKSEVINHSDGCPPSVEEAIKHLKSSVEPSENNTPSGKTSRYYHWIIKYLIAPIVATVIGGLILQKIVSYFSK